MNELERDIEARARAHFDEQVRRVDRWTDRFFAGLLIAQWAAAMGVAFWVSPLTWDGAESRVHAHVWTALILGGIIALPPSFLALRPSPSSARHVMAVAQMLIGVLLIHLTGGRIETHFHIFGSLALLAFYRDWKVLVLASAVVTVDHFLRGTYWPRSIFGVDVANPWRWVEHAGWVFFEDVFLVWSCFRSVAEMREVARKRAELEATRARIEATVRERTEDLRRGELRYRSLVEATSAIVWNTPESGLFESEQPGWGRFTGQTFEQYKNLGGAEAVHPDDREATARAWSEAIANRSIFRVEHRLRRHDGEYRHMQGWAVPIIDESGEFIEWFGIHSDVDTQTRAHEGMAQARRAAEAASRAKGEFLANMSHEIRTPMNGIIGMTELALDTDLTPQQREYLGTVRGSAEALLDVINDILDFSKIEAGKLALDPIPFSLRDCVDETLRVLALRAHVKGLELSVRIAPEVPDALVGDPGRLRQVIVNLVGNAIKFTERGEVTVSIEPAETPPFEGELALRLAVHDTGLGIPAEKLRSIFEPFEQADGSTTRKFGGTGLGLAISTKLVEMMGGRLAVDSEPGRGSTFAFEARFGLQPEAAASRRADPESLRGMPILVVDDNPTNRRILEEVLASWGAIPTAVDGGEAALRAIETSRAAGRPYRVVLLDGMMPEMDGYAVATRIAADPGWAGTLVVMLTSNDENGQLARCRSLGIAARLTKPVRQSELLEILMRLLPSGESPPMPNPPDGAPAPVPDPASVPDAAPRTFSILLAEDNVVNQKVVTSMLAKRGHEVAVVGDGRQALAALARGRFDLVLMDIQMPEMDGFEAVEAIRRAEAVGGPRLPVVALTAHAMKGDRERCLAAGFDAYITKPVRSEMLFEAVDGLMARTSEGVPLTSGGVADAPPAAFDLDLALESAGGDGGLLREILELFLDDAPRLLGEIEAAVDADDPGALRRAAHTMKGTASHFGAAGVVAAAMRLEAAGNAPSCRSAGPDAVALVEELDRFFDALCDLAPPIAPWRPAPVTSPSGPSHANA